jgi:DNA-binding winged helix-turn-helix (wHTH) protein
VFDLLVYLVRNRGRFVSKEDLIQSVWGGRIVSDSALTRRLNAARKAVNDSGTAQRLTRTVPRRGVHFIGEVSEEGELATGVTKGPNHSW